MSPTATIITVVAALIFFAWLFQSDTRDAGYEAYVRRQAEEKKGVTPQRGSLGISVTDAGVTKDTSTVADRPQKNRDDGPSDVGPGSGNATPASGIIGSSTGNDIRSPVEPEHRSEFPNNARLDGAFVGRAYIADVAQRSAPGEEPTIIFRPDHTFSSSNMGRGEVDMDPPAGGADRGSGKYKLSGNTLTLTYTDGLTRNPKGNVRVYTVLALEGAPKAPSAITIQGKVFRRAVDR